MCQIARKYLHTADFFTFPVEYANKSSVPRLRLKQKRNRAPDHRVSSWWKLSSPTARELGESEHDITEASST